MKLIVFPAKECIFVFKAQYIRFKSYFKNEEP
jgi:hypothetical protein